MTDATYNPIVDYSDPAYSAATLGGTSLLTAGWLVTNLDEVYRRVHRGSDYLAPRLDGVVARARKIGRLDVSLRMVFSGWENPAGTVQNANPVSGLIVNRRAFVAAVVDLPGTDTETRELAITETGQSAETADVHVEEFEWGAAQARGLARAVLRITIPAGLLTGS